MTTVLHKLSPREVQARLAAGGGVLVDIREADEFARAHVPGAQSRPLSALEQAHLAVDPGTDVIFSCRTGMRTAASCDRLAALVVGDAYVLDGGLDAWSKAGLPVEEDRRAPLEINRQVQIAAGLLILAGVILGFLVAPGWFGLSALVGAGLTFAGITGTCAMARLLMLAPWNRMVAA
ncbi:rhodanese family protein [Novosphingobium sp. G106]|uniref:rhodanese family protein n=1 Tax=Novosphingobium sp. G106 TaxID=2849500 RepID=UPI001C2D3674|nr:rhodanese family protein [Novosphingobium sp. G106]MBV1692602.1 rhodanese family protein [Novosphingobium sp. G106]